MRAEAAVLGFSFALLSLAAVVLAVKLRAVESTHPRGASLVGLEIRLPVKSENGVIPPVAPFTLLLLPPCNSCQTKSLQIGRVIASEIRPVLMFPSSKQEALRQPEYRSIAAGVGGGYFLPWPKTLPPQLVSYAPCIIRIGSDHRIREVSFEFQ